MFAASIWIAGLVDGQADRIGGILGAFDRSETWPGPVHPGVASPNNCEDFDRVYKINRGDVVGYEAGEPPSRDLQDWPTGLGAPTIDADGLEIILGADGVLAHVDAQGVIVWEERLSFQDRLTRKIDLPGGERPKLAGDQMLWWIMNDLGASHSGGDRSGSLPVGLEVHGSAFGFDAAGAVGNLVFYRFRLLHKGLNSLSDAYVSVFVDADLGWWLDDYVGVDTTLGLGFTYNATNEDQNYGPPVPAIGVDFFQGPLADPDGIDNDRDGETDESGERLGMTSFMRLLNQDAGGQSWENDPGSAQEFYNVMRGLWLDGAPMTFGGNGRDFSNQRTLLQFPGKPEEGEYWSEINTDGQGGRNIDNDRRFVMSSGPFDMEPGDTEEIVLGWVWSRGSDHLDSVRKLREDDLLAQQLFDIDFAIAAPPAAPRVTATSLDGQVILEWEYPETANNYLDKYREIDNLLSPDIADNDYVFEGYNVFRYADRQDAVGELVAVYDVANGVTRVIEGDPFTFIAADGRDVGVQHHHVFSGLTNYETYFFGVQAYAYNETSTRKVYAGPIARIEATPARVDNRDGGTLLNAELDTKVDSRFEGRFTAGKDVSVRVVNPSRVTGHRYEVRFIEVDGPSGPETSYDIVDVDLGEKVFDGVKAAMSLGGAAARGADVLLIDGLSWSVFEPPPDVLDIEGTPHSIGGGTPAFIQVEGIGDADACEPSAVSRIGCQEVGGNGIYGSPNGGGDWLMFHVGGGPEESLPFFAPHDFEIRVTESGSYGYYAFTSGSVIWVPFETWDIGSTGPFGVNDPADDERLIPVLFGDNGGDCFFGFGEIPRDQTPVNMPATDRAYAYYPVAGSTYRDWEGLVKPLVEAHPEGCPARPETNVALPPIDRSRPGVRPLQRLVWLMNPASPNYRDEMIPVGNVIRFLTTKPFEPGDVAVIETAELAPAPTRGDRSSMRLDQIGIVPNPYRGASEYEINHQADEVRFTNMPERATIRVFDLAGTLIRVLEKRSPESHFPWDLQTDTGLPIGSGVYFIHVEVPGVGEHAFKFAAVRKRAQLLIAR